MVARTKMMQLLWRDTEGSALIEASVLTPILFGLFFGVFEFSWYFYNQQKTEIGVRDAARYLARGPYFSTASVVSEDIDPCADAANVTRAKNLAVTGTIDGSGAARVVGWNTGNVAIVCTPFNNSAGNYAGPTTFYRVTVSTSFSDPALGFFGLLGLAAPNLSASHTQRSFGVG